MTISERSTPPMNAGERATLDGWLDFYRDTLAGKCRGLDENQLRHVSAEPSPLTLLGLMRHLAEVERNWFRRVLAAEEAPPIYAPEADPDGPDGGFEFADGDTFRAAVDVWQHEVRRSRENCSTRTLDEAVPFMGATVTLRWIYIHMIGEYARHSGHADLIRERIDGGTGV